MSVITQKQQLRALCESPPEEVALSAPRGVEKLAAIIECKLSQSQDSPPNRRISIQLSELAACLGTEAPKFSAVIQTIEERYQLRASTWIGPNGPALILAQHHSSGAPGSTTTDSAPMHALGLLVETKTGTLSKERWLSALQNNAVCNSILLALNPQVEEICGSYASSKGIKPHPNLLAEAQVATFKLLPAYDPKQSMLSTFLNNFLVPRMIDQLRAETRDRARTIFEKKVEAAQHEVQQRLSHRVSIQDPAIAEQLGMSAIAFSRLASRHLSAQFPIPGSPHDLLDSIAGTRSVSSSLELEESLQRCSPQERKMLSLAADGYHQIQIGHIFGLTQPSVSRALAAAREKFLGSVSTTGAGADSSSGLGFEVLAREVEVTGRAPSRWSQLTDYIDGLSFFSQLKISRAPFAREFKARWCGPNDSFRYDSLPAESQQVIAQTVRALAPTIDTLPDHHFFGDLFGLPSRSLTSSTTARLCIEHGILSAHRPYGYPFSPLENGGRRSRFFEADIVSPRIAHENIISFMRELYPTPDCIRRDLPGTAGLLELLGFGGAKGALAKWGLEHGVWPRSWPKGHPLLKGNSNTPSVLLQPEINGPVHAAACLSSAFLEAYPHIDAVSRSGGFAALFKVEEQAEQIARAALAAGIPVSTTRPSGYLLSRQMAPRARELAFFYRPEIVGHQIARSNLHRYIEEMVVQPADLKSLMLARALNATREAGEPLLQEGVFDAKALRVTIRARGLASP